MHLPKKHNIILLIGVTLLLIGVVTAAITMFVQTNTFQVTVTPMVTVTSVEELTNARLLASTNPSTGTQCTEQTDGQTWNCPNLTPFGGQNTTMAFWITGGQPLTPILTQTVSTGITPAPTETTNYAVCTNSYGQCYFNTGISTGLPTITTGEWLVIFVTYSYTPSASGTSNIYVSLGR